MKNDSFEIRFVNPNVTINKNYTKNNLVEDLIKEMIDNSWINFSGYSNENSLKESIYSHIGKGSINEYSKFSTIDKNKIEKIVNETITLCSKKLKIPTKNYIYIYPFIPNKEEVKIFDGVLAIASYSCVFHVFVSAKKYTEFGLKSTVAHELNHTIFYYYNYDKFNKYSLFDNIIMEGLAENFREDVIPGKPAPWSVALDKQTAFKIYENSKDVLDSVDSNDIKNYLFGNKKYKKWTGYSVGYWLIKNMINKTYNNDWNKIMQLKSKKTQTLISDCATGT